MAYVDQNQSKEKTIAAVITAIILAAVGYAFITGLAFTVIKKTAEKLNVIDIKTPPPPPPKKPPPPPRRRRRSNRRRSLPPRRSSSRRRSSHPYR